MEKIKQFYEYFTGQTLEGVSKTGNSYFLADENLREISKKSAKQPFSIGLPLGREKNRKLIPGANLLDMIAEKTSKKIFVNERTEWLFLCGRDVFGKGIVKADVKKGKVLVQNEKDESIGYGEIVNSLSAKDKPAVKNLFDKGDFLRREKKEVKHGKKN